MKIPRRNIEKFVREVAEQCFVSQGDRATRGEYYRNYFLYGGEDAENAAIYNKTGAYIDELASLLYSPVSLRFNIGDPDLPNILEQAKGRAAAARLRQMARASNTDTCIGDVVVWSLVKGNALIKETYKRGQFQSELIQPETFGVFRENHTALDEDMEAFAHSMLITPYQFDRMIWNHPDRELFKKRARRAAGESRLRRGGTMQITVGGLYPFQPGGSQTPNVTRGLVDWMSAPSPQLSPDLSGQLLRLDEVWIWDDDRRDWATFQIIGDDILLMGKYFSLNAFAYDTTTSSENEHLKGLHPFVDFCPNRVDDYFWGRSEIANVALLQEAMNARITGINRLLRKQEDPPKSFSGASGINQQALAKFNKPGGYWTDSNPNAKLSEHTPTISADLWASLHEYERMFDDMGGLPPIARGRGDAGVRSGSHADTLVRMFSPRFKDRALLVERDVAALGNLMLNLSKAHEAKRLIAWVPQDSAGVEAEKPSPLIVPPFDGAVAVPFRFADLDEDMTLTVDSHSSSPAFSQDAKNLLFDFFKIGAIDAAGVVEHSDAPQPEQLISGIARREIAKAAAEKAELQVKAQGRAH